MAVVKPVVFGPDGALRNIQAGDTLAGGSETGIINLTAAAALIAGNAVYSSAAGAVNKAQANAAATRTVIGLTTGAIASAASGPVQMNGVLSLSTAQWDAVCGTTGGLTFNVPNLLDVCSKLGEQGVKFVAEPTQQGFGIMALVADPDGNIMALWEDNVTPPAGPE